MLASWNRSNSTEVFTSQSHLPESPAERERIDSSSTAEVRACGGEDEEEASYRIYLKGENVPGLTMSRALGDLALANCGAVSQIPEYSKFGMQPSDEYYVLLASDGIVSSI